MDDKTVGRLREQADRATRLADQSTNSDVAQSLRRQAELLNQQAGEIEAERSGMHVKKIATKDPFGG